MNSSLPTNNSCKCVSVQSHILDRGLMDQSTIYKDKVEPGQASAVANDDVNEAAKNLV